MMSDPGPGYSLWILSIVIHGFCYGFFFTAGQVYVGNVASKSIQASAQGLIALITFGLGQGAGSIISGRILEHYTVDGAIQWSQVWFLPMIVALVVGVLFALLFRVKPTEAKAVDIAEA